MAARPQRAAYKEARFLSNRLDFGFTVPGRSSDPARDGREAGMDLPLPMKAARHDHDLMMLADHDGPDLEMPGRLAPAPSLASSSRSRCFASARLRELSVAPTNRKLPRWFMSLLQRPSFGAQSVQPALSESDRIPGTRPQHFRRPEGRIRAGRFFVMGEEAPIFQPRSATAHDGGSAIDVFLLPVGARSFAPRSFREPLARNHFRTDHPGRGLRVKGTIAADPYRDVRRLSDDRFWRAAFPYLHRRRAQQSGVARAWASPADIARRALPPPRSFRRSGFLGAPPVQRRGRAAAGRFY